MTQPKSEFLRAASERGFIHQCTDTDALDDLASNGIVTAYIGFDATADSLHAGSLVAHHAAAVAATNRPSTDCPDGGRHHKSR